MSITKDEKILNSDIANLYSKLNTVISNYGGSIAKTTSPAVGDKIDNADINDLKDKVTELKNDSYLGSVSSLYLTYSVTNEGTSIAPSTTITNLSTTILTNLQKIKCRNSATNSNTNKSHGSNSHGSNPNGTRDHDFPEFIQNSISGGSICRTFRSFWNGANFFTTCTHGTRSNTVNSHKTTVDILNSLTTKSNTT